jgi:hypothetical protein
VTNSVSLNYSTREVGRAWVPLSAFGRRLISRPRRCQITGWGSRHALKLSKRIASRRLVPGLSPYLVFFTRARSWTLSSLIHSRFLHSDFCRVVGCASASVGFTMLRIFKQCHLTWNSNLTLSVTMQEGSFNMACGSINYPRVTNPLDGNSISTV